MRRSCNPACAVPVRAILFVLMILVPLTSWAVHEQIACDACHNLFEKDPDRPHLSVGTISGACLSCHDAEQDRSGLDTPYVMNERDMLAGGSFTGTVVSDKVGHNMTATDSVLRLTPPGGEALNEFNCVSCHDHHSNGSYRNLKTEINGMSTIVQADPDPLYQENVYISGMNEFCGSCHERFHGEANTRRGNWWIRHPVGIPIYGAEHADFQGWSRREPELTLVENPTGDSNDRYAAQVFCLSCHFAHGSSNRNAMRWENYRSNRGCLECHSLDNS